MYLCIKGGDSAMYIMLCLIISCTVCAFTMCGYGCCFFYLLHSSLSCKTDVYLNTYKIGGFTADSFVFFKVGKQSSRG